MVEVAAFTSIKPKMLALQFGLQDDDSDSGAERVSHEQGWEQAAFSDWETIIANTIWLTWDIFTGR